MYTRKQLFMEEVLRQKKSYVAEVGLREYQCLWDLVTCSPSPIKEWKDLLAYLGEFTNEGKRLADENAGMI